MRTYLVVLLSLLLFACATPVPPGAPAVAPAVEPPVQPAPAAAVAPTPSPGAEFDKLADDYFEELLRLDPLLATSIGDDRYNSIFPVAISEEHRGLQRTVRESYRERLEKIDPSALTGQQHLSRSMLLRRIQDDLALLQFPSHLIPLNQFSSATLSFAQLGSGTSIHRFRTTRDYDDFLGRVSGFEQWVDTAIANMRRGVAAGVVQPRSLMEKVVPQLEAHIVADPTQSIFFTPLRAFPAAVPQPDRDRLTAAYSEAITNRIVPAYRRLRDFVRDEYLPKTRATSGLGALPQGDAWYRLNVASITTTQLTPQQIHEVGLAEVARIHGEMTRIKDRLGFKGDLLAFFDHVSTNPKFFFSSREEMIQSYRDAKGVIDVTLPKVFDVMPRADFEIRPVEAFRERSAAGGQYSAATPDGSRPGVVYINTYDLKARPRYDVTSLLLHEGNPGHHFQISIQRELTGVPRFRRFSGYTAYSEGWGLYAESLGHELGLYSDPYQYYGQLAAELWRSIRLVLDTGIHAKGWSREKAIDYAKNNSSTGETRVTSEVERFMAIPGQALAYKVGQLEISRLRREAEAALGQSIDIKGFHRTVLVDGALPLDMLDAKVHAWIAGQSSPVPAP